MMPLGVIVLPGAFFFETRPSRHASPLSLSSPPQLPSLVTPVTPVTPVTFITFITFITRHVDHASRFKIIPTFAKTPSMECRPHCGACCIAPSISSQIPGMPDGKPAGVRCIHLTEDFRCDIFEDVDRPKVCDGFKAEELVCGKDREEALKILEDLEKSCAK